MATVIRLKRGGRTHAPYYRVVVMDSRAAANSRVIEEIGVYHPCARPEPIIEVQEDRVLDWMNKGARPSATVRNFLSKQGIMAKFASGETAAAGAGAAAPAPAPEAAEASE